MHLFGSCIHQNKYLVRDDEYNYHNSLQAPLIEGVYHFTVLCSVTWPLNGSEAEADDLLCFCHVNAPSQHKNNLIYTTKAMRSDSKQDHLQPGGLFKARPLSRQL